MEAGLLCRNAGVRFDGDWVQQCVVNRSAVERRAGSLSGRRTVKRVWQAGWLLRAVTCMDLTSLSGDDTEGRVRRLCAKARMPVRGDVLELVGAGGLEICVGAVCVYHSMLGTVVDALAGSGVRAAVVSTGFPAGMSPFGLRVREIEESVAGGADEVDVVISRGLALRGDWRGVYDEVCAFRAACGDAHLKVILGTGDLGTLTNVARASVVCMMAGADFVKTSTGKEAVNATLPVGLVMCRAVREYWERTGFKVGLKPAGGIRTAKQALDWLMLVREELGAEWCVPGLFRLGASTLLGDIERQLLHCGTGRYGAWHEMPLG